MEARYNLAQKAIYITGESPYTYSKPLLLRDLFDCDTGLSNGTGIPISHCVVPRCLREGRLLQIRGNVYTLRATEDSLLGVQDKRSALPLSHINEPSKSVLGSSTPSSSSGTSMTLSPCQLQLELSSAETSPNECPNRQESLRDAGISDTMAWKSKCLSRWGGLFDTQCTPLFSCPDDATDDVWKTKYETICRSYPSQFDFHATPGLRGLFAFPTQANPVGVITRLPTLLSHPMEDPFELRLEPILKPYFTSVDDTTVVRVDRPFPICNSGVSYFEIKVTRWGKCVGVGVVTGRAPIGRTQEFIGWSEQSYAYHGDDGQKWNGFDTYGKYGPAFKQGDIVGCGINWETSSIFFTKNGVFLGDAFSEVWTNHVPFLVHARKAAMVPTIVIFLWIGACAWGALLSCGRTSQTRGSRVSESRGITAYSLAWTGLFFLHQTEILCIYWHHSTVHNLCCIFWWAYPLTHDMLGDLLVGSAPRWTPDWWCVAG